MHCREVIKEKGFRLIGVADCGKVSVWGETNG